MHDVARAANVSIATVSRTLSGRPGVSEETRARVRAVADRLDYVVSPEASRLARGETGRIAVLVSSVGAWFFATMLSHIESELREHGFDVLLFQLGSAGERRAFFESLPARRKADAVIVVTLPVPEEQASRLDLLGMHVVVAGGRLLDHPCVRIDDRAVGELATAHLVGLGHRRIAMVRTRDAEGLIWTSDRDRHRGYADALARADLPSDETLVHNVEFGIEGGRAAVDHLWSLPDPPTAVFAHSDEIAIGVVHQLRDRGLRVPEDVSVVGVDDHPFAALYDLTTVRQDIAAQARGAAASAVRLVRGEPGGRDDQIVPCELVVRGSTAVPPDGA